MILKLEEEIGFLCGCLGLCISFGEDFVMSNKMQEVFYGHLDRLIENKLPYAIWGAGWTGKNVKRMIAEYSKGTLLEKYTIDNNPSLWDKEGMISPNDFFNDVSSVDTVFVCVYVADEVIEQITENGYRGNLIPINSTILESDYYVDWYEKNRNDIEGLFDILADEQSVETIKTFYKVANTGDISFWDNVNGKSKDKLLDPELLKFTDEEHMVEVGAFIGDTTDRFLELCSGKYKSIVGLEPDPDNFSVLENKFKRLNNAKAMQMAASDKSGKARFTSNMSESGYLINTGDIEVDVTKLDDLEDAWNATFIKISTNGLDLSALKGAGEIIKNNSPKLSYYCWDSQLWTIPMYLKSLNSNYKIYVRHYGIGMQGLIGYAVL